MNSFGDDISGAFEGISNPPSTFRLFEFLGLREVRLQKNEIIEYKIKDYINEVKITVSHNHENSSLLSDIVVESIKNCIDSSILKAKIHFPNGTSELRELDPERRNMNILLPAEGELNIEILNQNSKVFLGLADVKIEKRGLDMFWVIFLIMTCWLFSLMNFLMFVFEFFRRFLS